MSSMWRSSAFSSDLLNALQILFQLQIYDYIENEIETVPENGIAKRDKNVKNS